MSHVFELLGRGVNRDLSDLLDRYYWSAPTEEGDQPGSPSPAREEDCDRRLQLAQAYFRAGQVDDAIDHLRRACEAEGDNFAARVALASALDEKGDPAGALEQLGRADRISPDRAEVLFGMGFCCEKLHRPMDAAGHYRRARTADTGFVPARERLAAIDVLLGGLDEAIEQYEAVRDIEPQEITHRSVLAHLYFRAGRPGDAIDEFETAIALEPDNWALVDDDVEAMVSRGDIPEAMVRLRSLIAEQGPFADLHVRLADLCSKVRDDDGAMRNYLLALSIQPGYLEATVKLGTHHLINRRWEEAAEAFHRAAELNDRLLNCYVGMGVAQASLGERDDAMNSFELACAVEPNSTLLVAETMKLQLRATRTQRPRPAEPGDTGGGIGASLLVEQAKRHAEEVRKHPRDADVRYRYGVLLRAQDKALLAMDQFEEAVRLNACFTKARIKLGVVRKEWGMAEEAVEAFCQAMDVDQQAIENHYRLALLYTNRESFQQELRRLEEQAGDHERDRVRSHVSLALQNMALLDRVSATWQSLKRIHHARAG